jgi:hypothetical protein
LGAIGGMEHQDRFGTGPFGVVVPILGYLKMQVAITVDKNVLGCKNSPKTAVVVSLLSIECEGSPPLIVFERH